MHAYCVLLNTGNLHFDNVTKVMTMIFQSSDLLPCSCKEIHTKSLQCFPNAKQLGICLLAVNLCFGITATLLSSPPETSERRVFNRSYFQFFSNSPTHNPIQLRMRRILFREPSFGDLCLQVKRQALDQ